MRVCGESSLRCTEVTVILKNVYLATFTASQQHARISTELLYLPMKQAWDIVFSKAGHLQKNSGPSPPGFTYSTFDRKTRIYPALRSKSH